MKFEHLKASVQEKFSFFERDLTIMSQIMLTEEYLPLKRSGLSITYQPNPLERRLRIRIGYALKCGANFLSILLGFI